MAVEKAGEGESDTCEFVTGPRRERHHGLTSADGWNTGTTLSSRGSIGHVSFVVSEDRSCTFPISALSENS